MLQIFAWCWLLMQILESVFSTLVGDHSEGNVLCVKLNEGNLNQWCSPRYPTTTTQLCIIYYLFLLVFLELVFIGLYNYILRLFCKTLSLWIIILSLVRVSVPYMTFLPDLHSQFIVCMLQNGLIRTVVIF